MAGGSGPAQRGRPTPPYIPPQALPSAAGAAWRASMVACGAAICCWFGLLEGGRLPQWRGREYPLLAHNQVAVALIGQGLLLWARQQAKRLVELLIGQLADWHFEEAVRT